MMWVPYNSHAAFSTPDIASRALYDGGMNLVEGAEQARIELAAAADTVRVREAWLETARAARDVLIYDMSHAGYSLSQIAEICELSKSMVALVVKLQDAMRANYKLKDIEED